MSSRKVLQIAIPNEQRDLIEFVLRVYGVKASSLVRRLLLEWAAAMVKLPGTTRGGLCGVAREGCLQQPADYFNIANRVFMCRTCAEVIVASSPSAAGVIVPATGLHQPAIDLDKLREALEAARAHQKDTESLSAKSSAELLRTIRDAADELLVRENAKGAPTFDDLVERFA